jgi:hypothetical protein
MTGHFTSYENRTDHELATSYLINLSTRHKNVPLFRNVGMSPLGGVGWSGRARDWLRWGGGCAGSP